MNPHVKILRKVVALFLFLASRFYLHSFEIIQFVEEVRRGAEEDDGGKAGRSDSHRKTEVRIDCYMEFHSFYGVFAIWVKCRSNDFYGVLEFLLFFFFSYRIRNNLSIRMTWRPRHTACWQRWPRSNLEGDVETGGFVGYDGGVDTASVWGRGKAASRWVLSLCISCLLIRWHRRWLPWRRCWEWIMVSLWFWRSGCVSACKLKKRGFFIYFFSLIRLVDGGNLKLPSFRLVLCGDVIQIII